MISPTEPEGSTPASQSAPEPGPSASISEGASDAGSVPGSASGPVAPRRGGIRGFLGRLFSPLTRIPHPSLNSRRGAFIVVILFMGLASAATVGSVAAVTWTETADFCGRCHTMDPELKGHELSAHREVACAECHVEPGLAGWVKAKLNGTRQLIMVLTGSFETPIPPPDHGDLPPTSATCVRCHDTQPLVADGGPVKLVLQERFDIDEANSKDEVALVLRPAGFGGTTATRGVHWHIAGDVEYLSPDPRARSIDYVATTGMDGGTTEYLASSAVTNSGDVQPDIDRLMAEQQPLRQMDCIDCHNRAGHGMPTPDQAIDDSISAQRIDRNLPFVKREASARLAGDYATLEEADRAIEGLRSFYQTRYPLVAAWQGPQVNAAIDDLKRIYRLVATPEMRVTGTTYPNNLGHQASPGCFRCHDGAHYKVENGALTQESIPSACATCHTFPQIGSTASGVLIGERPATHDDRLWVFNHKTSAGSLDPAGTSCGACHTRTYCENCHQTEAVKVPHDDMVFGHADVMKKTGPQACAYCHQPAYCAQCHSDDVLAGASPWTGHPDLAPPDFGSEGTMSLDGHRPARAPEWVSIHEAALLMGVSSATLRRWSDAGDIQTFTTPGGHRRFSLTAIDGLLPAVGSKPASRDRMLEEVRQRTDRILTSGLRRMARDAAWPAETDPRDLALVERHLRRVVDGLLGSLDAPRANSRASAWDGARSAATACGELAGTRAFGLCQTVDTWLLLRRIVIRELSSSARRHDQDVSWTTRWLDAASHGLDLMLEDVMRGHELADATRTP